LKLLTTLLIVAIFTTSCGSGNDTPTAGEPAPAGEGLRLVTPAEAVEIQANDPAGLIVLDVRTPQEFAEGHLENATMIDFYEPDFASQLADLDPTQPYLLYCRSGNRSGQTLTLMKDLGFTNVAEIDGGTNAWTAAGLPLR
jgi:rhodanese-related sulfurtransferase